MQYKHMQICVHSIEGCRLDFYTMIQIIELWKFYHFLMYSFQGYTDHQQLPTETEARVTCFYKLESDVLLSFCDRSMSHNSV